MAGGYEYNFVEPPDELLCMVCHHIAREAHQMECCGKVFCKTCINDDRILSCPNCREASPRIFRDLRSSRDIKRLRVICENEGNGCEWSGALEEYETHKRGCGFEEVRCSNWPLCKQMVQRQHLNDHKDTVCPGRKERCHVCYNAIARAEMPKHCFKCPKVEVVCTNFGCSVGMLREQLDAHKSICPKERIPCPYRNSGCNAVILREDRQKHLEENIELHSNIANDTCSTLRKELAETKTALESKRVPPVTYMMSNYLQLKETQGDWKSPCFYTHEGGYKMILHVYAGYHDEDCLAVFIHIVSGPNDDKLVWPFAGSVKMEILNQHRDHRHHSLTLHWNGAANEFRSAKKPAKGRENTGRGYPNFISHTDLENESTSHTYLKNDCIYFRISEASAATQCKPWLICSP